ncbi:RHS repeat-associated core domain protein [Burkholderiales bacterium JOSHI_001]|nr:RHS repeat-associated core domain protein [Burkholderiales bacterium JOSHI_001]
MSRVLAALLLPGLVVNPATPLNPKAYAFWDAGYWDYVVGGGSFESFQDEAPNGAVDNSRDWLDDSAGGEGGFPDNGTDETGDVTFGLDEGGDSWIDAEDPDSSAVEPVEDASGDNSEGSGDPNDDQGNDTAENPGRSEVTDSCGGTGSESVGDPINLARADKVHFQVDYRGRDFAPLRASRVYHSNLAEFPARATVPIGAGWRFFYDRSLQVLSASQVRLHRYDGSVLDFSYNGSAWISAKPSGSLSTVAGGWQYVNPRNGIETYNAAGRLLSVSKKGRLTNLQYDAAGRLVGVANPFGRSMTLAYDATGRVSGITIPGGATLAYGYDAIGNLVSVNFPDAAVRRYAYDNLTWRNALTGIVDETGRRIVTWGYDAAGRPNYSHYGNGINPVSVTYGSGSVATTDARGTVRTRTLLQVGGRQRVVALNVGATPDNAATTTSYGFDGYGNLGKATARSGAVNVSVNDPRGRPLSVTRASGTASARTVQHVWHGIFNIATSTSAGGVSTNRTVDGFGRVIQTSRTGTNGVSYVMRQRVYNAQHLLASVTNARGGVTTFTYDAQGNRTSATNPAGQTTTYSLFDAHGRPTRIVRPSGAVVTRVFNNRGRLAQHAVNGVASTRSFDGAGRLSQLTQADGSWVARSYDTAGRIAGLSNHKGESVSIGRDVGGKVVSRATYGAAGNLVHAAYARFDRLGRVAAQIDTRGFATQATYGADARRSGTVDALGRQYSQQLDQLNRPVSFTQPNTTAMRLAGGATTVSTQLNWDSANATLKSVADTVNVGTGYGVDTLNRRAAETGSDAGTRQWARNAAGDTQTYVDGRSVSYTVVRDTLGRPLQVGPAGIAPITYSYVPGRRDSLLSSMTDPSGSTTWTYDSEGRVLSKSQTIAAVTSTVTLARDSLGRVASMTYPSGMRVDYTYTGDTVSSVAVNGTVLLNSITYRPFSRTPAKWAWGNGSVYQRSFDADGRITQVTLGGLVRSYTYDPTGRITEYNDVLSSGATQRSAFRYDEAGQLTSYSGPGGNFSYAYDTNGNRRSQTRNGVTTTQTYAAASNRLLTSPRGTYSYLADGSPSSDGIYTYSYDAFGRMSGLTGFGGTVFSSRAHDGLGMRVRLLRQEYTPPEPLAVAPGGTSSRSAALLSSRIVTAETGATAVQNGRATSQGVVNTTWSMPDRAAVLNTDRLASRTAGNVAQLQVPPPGGGGWLVTDNIRYLHTDDGLLLSEYNLISGYRQETIWFAGVPIGTMINGTLLTIRSDHLGTPRSLARASDNFEVWRWDGEPFGDSRPVYSGPIIFDYNLRFPGQQYEPNTGYFQNWFRDYDPYTGRYLQADPLGLGGGLGRYTYSGADPVNAMDPTGLDWEYETSTGRIYRNGQLIGVGYSGNQSGLNNPDAQNTSNVGPIPKGSWNIGGAYKSQNTGPQTIVLTPKPETETYGRSAFRIHGDNSKGNMSASNGCIVASPSIRDQIINSGDKLLVVRP